MFTITGELFHCLEDAAMQLSHRMKIAHRL